MNKPPGFRIGGEENECLFVEFLARQHPHSHDYWDGNWLITRITVAAGRFRGRYEASLRCEEVARLIKGDRLGHYTAACVAVDKPGVGNRLEFEPAFDQSYVPSLLDDLAATLQAFPVKSYPEVWGAMSRRVQGQGIFKSIYGPSFPVRSEGYNDDMTITVDLEPDLAVCLRELAERAAPPAKPHPEIPAEALRRENMYGKHG